MTALAITLEDVLTGRGFADVPASPLQRALARAAEGRPLDNVIDMDMCARHFGCEELPHARPRRVVVVGGIRGGKSQLACCAAIHATLTADLSRLKRHERPRFAIVGPTVDAARATFVQLVGILQASLVLRRFMVGDPTVDTVVIRRPDGRDVEIVVVAAHRGGLSVRNRWLVGLVLEEVASFGSETTGAVINGEAILQAGETRLLDGCQAWLISSPFGPTGLLWELYKRHYGKPGTTLVVHAPTRALNPSFPQSRIDEIAREDPDTAAREYGAEWTDADSAFLSSALIDRVTRSAPLVRNGKAIAAAMDPATRGNSWTLAVSFASPEAVAQADPGLAVQTRVTIAGVWTWTGSRKAPLSPRVVLEEIAGLLRPYGVSRILTDGWALDALADHAAACGLQLAQHQGDRDAPYLRLRTLLQTELIELPPDPVMRHDLLAVRQRATSSGMRIHLPRTADGRHCDFAPSVALAAWAASCEGAEAWRWAALSDEKAMERWCRAMGG